MLTKPNQNEYHSFFETYLSLVNDADVLQALTDQLEEVQGAFKAVPVRKLHFRYAPNKWTVLEVLGHLVDTERVLGFRAFSFARGEEAELPGMDEDSYVKEAAFNKRSLESLLGEFTSLRQSHLHFFEHLTDPILLRRGVANGHEISVRALAAIMLGHVRHHLSILDSRYNVLPEGKSL